MRRIRHKLVGLHRDERGLTSVETVAILTLAAIILIVLRSQWVKIKHWFRDSVHTVVNWQGDVS